MNGLLVAIGNMLKGYSLGQKAVIIVIFLGIISSTVSLVMWANRPEYIELHSDLNPATAGRIVSELRGMKIKYRLSNGGKTILVPSNQVMDLRLKFAQEGYTDKSVLGYEIFDNSKIGMTTFMQELNLRRALEGELTKTINQFPAIKNSRVHLVIPKRRLFNDDKSGSASVVLYLQPGKYLSEYQINGIRTMVSSSVEGIDLDNVVIVDSEGNLLSKSRGDDMVLGSAGNQWDLRHRIESKLQRKVTDIVEGIVGFNNSVIKVAVDINFEQVERTLEFYDPENVVIVSEERHTESNTNVDTSENINENYQKENVITNYELNKTVEHFVSNTGTINKLSVAVLINGGYKTTQDENGQDVTEYVPRSKKDLAQITALVKSAVGYNEERGDVIEVGNLQFDKGSVEADKEYFNKAENRAMWAEILNKSFIGVGILIAFLLVRTLIKNTGTVLQLPVTNVVPALKTASSYQVKSAPVQVIEEDEISEDIYIAKLSPEARAKLKAKDKMTSEVVSYSKDNPEDAARLIRSWLTQPN